MWPWEHLLLGYVTFSLATRVASHGGQLLTTRAVWLVAFCSQLPDLVDKPLAWQVGVFRSGFAVAHSAVVAVPVSLLALWLGLRRGRSDLGLAVATGYLSHLVGDLLYSSVTGGGPTLRAVAWPFVRGSLDEPTVGFVTRFLSFVRSYVRFLDGPAGIAYLALEVLLVAGCLLLWADDGYPGWRSNTTRT